MKTTVIIPNYNGRDYLRACLDSLLLCEPMDFHIMVVDNGSTDGSVELLKHNYPSVETIFLEENTGFAPAVNVGLHATKTIYGLLLNNDTTVETDFVKKMEEALEKRDNIFSVSAKMLSMQNPEIIDGAGDLYCALGWAFALGKGKSAKEHYTKETKIFSACGGAAIYRMNIMEKIGYFDDNHFAYLEDVDVGYRAMLYGYENRYSPDAVCYHAGSGFSGSRYNEFKVTLSSRNSTYLIVKNMPIIQQIINLPLFVIGFGVKWLFFIRKGFGLLYLKGLMKGIALGYSKEGRKHRLPFKLSRLNNYIKIQCKLWINIFRRIVG